MTQARVTNWWFAIRVWLAICFYLPNRGPNSSLHSLGYN